MSSMRITQITDASADTWRETFEACEYATYFHSPGWGEVWREYSGGAMTPAPSEVEFSDGRTAILVRSRDGSVSPPAYWSSPVGTFGGWIARQPLTPSHAVLLQEELLRPSNVVWRVNPYDPFAASLPRPSERPEDTLALDLRAGLAAVQARWRSTQIPWSVRRARRKGLTTRIATTLDDWRAYYGLYELSLTRWGSRVTSRYEWPLFEAIARRPPHEAQLWLVAAEDVPVAGGLVFYAPRHAVYWHGAADAAWFGERPVTLFVYEAVLDAVNRGLWWFDFNPSGGHGTVAAFKRGCGAAPRPCPVVSS
jgi:hypothetical protein